MENKKLDSNVCRLAIVIFMISLLCLLIVEKPSAEFVITLLTLGISLVTFIVSVIRIRKKDDRC